MRQIRPAIPMVPIIAPTAIRASRRRLIGASSSGGTTVLSDGAARNDPRAGGSLAGNDSRLAWSIASQSELCVVIPDEAALDVPAHAACRR